MTLASSVATFSVMLRRNPLEALELLQLRVERTVGVPLFFLSAPRLATAAFEFVHTRKKDDSLTAYGNYCLDTKMLPEKPVVFSLGVGHTIDDVSFDLALLKRHDAQLFLVDPTPGSKRLIDSLGLPANVRFLPFAVTDRDGPVDLFCCGLEDDIESASTVSILNPGRGAASSTADGRRLRTLMRDCGVDHIDVLKMDIEGAGLQVLGDTLRDGIFPSQIACEFERPTIPGELLTYFKKLSEVFALLEADYDIYRTRDTERGFQVEILAVLSPGSPRRQGTRGGGLPG